MQTLTELAHGSGKEGSGNSAVLTAARLVLLCVLLCFVQYCTEIEKKTWIWEPGGKAVTGHEGGQDPSTFPASHRPSDSFLTPEPKPGIVGQTSVDLAACKVLSCPWKGSESFTKAGHRT